MGIQLGQITLDRRVGQGAMGEVWRGHHGETPVAVKVLSRPPHELAATFHRAFHDEVRALADLDHPHIARIYDAGTVPPGTELPDGSPYIVMELLRGTLHRRLERFDSFGQIRDLLMALLDALAHAHARGVVHRDLKPANLMFDGAGRIKLVDFGLVHLTRQAEAASGPAWGTPGYMAPEQATGSWRDFGPWTDLYAVGSIAWRLACRRSPWGEGEGEVLAFRQLGRPDPPLDPVLPVPEGFAEWLAGMMAGSPVGRFRRAADAAWALARLPDAPAAIGPGARFGVEPGTSPTIVPLPLTRVTLAWSDHTGSRPGIDDPVPVGILSDIPIPGLPRDWDRPVPVARHERLQGAGLGLYAVRRVPLAGRDRERDRLWATLRRVVAARRPELVLITGPSGQGKSRLARWLCERAHEVGAVDWLHVQHEPHDPEDRLPAALAGALGVVGLAGGELDDRIGAWLRARGCDSPAVIDGVRALLGGGGLAGPREAVHLTIQVLIAAAAERPVVLWLDDVQWGHRTLQTVEALLPVQIPVLVVATARDDLLVESPLAAGWLEAHAEHPQVGHIALGPLDPASQRRLVRELLGLQGDVAAQLERRTAGNPMFAVQLVGEWIARGVLEPGPGGFRLAANAELVLSEDVRGLIEARLRRATAGASEPDLRALELAAVLGVSVATDEWADACAAVGLEPSIALVDRLAEQRLVTWSSASTWSFAHPMLREVLEQGARASARLEDLHTACANVLAERPGWRIALRRARHLLAAGRPAEAVEPLLYGAGAWIERCDYARARGLALEVLALLERLGVPESDPRWGRAWEQLIHAGGRSGDEADAAEWLDRLESAAHRHGWAYHQVSALVLRANRAGLREGAVAELAFLDRALALVRAGAPFDVAILLHDRASALSFLGRMAEAEPIFAEAIAAFEAGGRWGPAAQALVSRASNALRMGLHAEAHDHLDRAEDIRARTGARTGQAQGFKIRGNLHMREKRYDEARLCFEAAIDLEEAKGRPGTAVSHRVNLALIDLETGRYLEARRSLVALREAIGSQLMEWLITICVLPCHAGLGDWSALEQDLQQSAAWLRRGPPSVEPALVDYARMAADLAADAGQRRLASRAETLADAIAARLSTGP